MTSSPRQLARVCLFSATCTLLAGCATRDAGPTKPAAPLETWRTHAERTAFRETGRYDSVVAFCRRLAEASSHARYATFGTSAEGRQLPLLVLSRDGTFDPAAARRSGKALVLIENCIHPGECEGKDASLALARDIVVTREHLHLLDHLNILILPIFNPDGHERFSPYSRINQNGPAQMGWRVTATNLNLNRDFMKADTPEMRAWLALFHAWQPDVFIDNHTTNGSDHRYDVLYAAGNNPLAAPGIVAYLDAALMPPVLAAMHADGFLTLPYAGARDESELTKGIFAPGGYTARFSTGYGAICNRPSILVEVHALKPYARRVQSNYAFMLHTLETISRQTPRLKAAIAEADADCTATRGGEYDGGAPVRVERGPGGRPIIYHGYRTILRPSEITGADVIEYTTDPVDVETLMYDESRTVRTIQPPAAYLVPPQWTDVIARLDWHGIATRRLCDAREIEVESYRFQNVTFAPRPYEGRQLPKYDVVPVRETRTFPAGTVVVPLDQPRAKLAIHLLEPDAPDSLVAWGFFNAVFEQKEYFEAYVMEPIARRMLAEDAALRRAFETQLADEAFAASPDRRLSFFYERSPYFDEQLNVYPVGRVMDAASLDQ